MTKRISTAAYLAGVTTLAVSLPMMASARASGAELTDAAKAMDAAKSDCVQVDKRADDSV